MISASITVVAVLLLAWTCVGDQAEDDFNKAKWQSLLRCVVCQASLETVAAEDTRNETRVRLSHRDLKDVCGEYIQPFREACITGMESVIEMLGSATEVNRAQLHSQCHRAEMCTVPSISRKQAAVILQKRCGAGTHSCTVNHHVRNVIQDDTLLADLAEKHPYREKNPIPNIIHFMFGFKPDFGGKPFGILHYLAVKSARVHNPTASILMYYVHEPSGEWWDKAKALVRLVRVDPVTVVGRFPVQHVAHISDMLRLMLLRDIGGVYLDIDMITFKPYSSLYKNQFVIGQEGKAGVYGLCNAVLLSAPNSTFVKDWINFLPEGYDLHIWSMHSVKLPSFLSYLYKENVYVAPNTKFFEPLWDQLEHMFRGKYDSFAENIAMHTWESLAYDKYIAGLTEEYIRTVDNNFNLAVRQYLPGGDTADTLSAADGKKKKKTQQQEVKEDL